MSEKTFTTKTVLPKNTVVDDKLKPTAEMHILVGGPYTSGGVEHLYGHTALYIRLKGKEYIYDFGRYGLIYSETVALGLTLEGVDSPRGEGILRVWNSFAKYIQSENSYGRSTWGYKYLIFDAQADKVVNHFSDLTKTTKRHQSTGNMVSYKLPTDYFALGPNCTTLSVDAAKKAVPKIVAGSEKYIKPEEVLPWHARKAMEMKYGTPKHIFLPANLKTYLDTTPAVRVDEKKTYGGGR